MPIYFVRHDLFYHRPGLYNDHGIDYQDNCRRFVFFSRAVLEAIRLLNLDVDIIHSNDWQTGLVPAYLQAIYKSKSVYKDPFDPFTNQPFDELPGQEKANVPQSPLYDKIKAKFPTMSHATVYKTLALLKEINQVFEIDLHGDSHYDGVASHYLI